MLFVLGGGGGLIVLKSPLGKGLLGSMDREGGGTEVRLEAAELGDLVRTVSAPGSIEPKTLVQISSQVSAKIIALPFREGDMVKADDVVVRLDPQDLVARLDASKASLKSEQARLTGAEASLINARLNYERLRQLYETGDVTKADLDAAEAQFLGAKSNKQVIEASIEMAQANIEQAQKDLDNTTITSPIDGIITVLNTEVGETAIVGTTNTPGSVIMEIADLSEMLVKAQIDETNIAPVEEGQGATVYINAYDDREFRGKVQKVGLKRQVAADGTGVFNTEILLGLEEGERLYSGLTASVDIEVESFYDVVRVPSQSVLDRRVEDLPEEIVRSSEHVDPTKTFARVVYRLIDGKAVATPVEVGPSDLTHTVILGGLEVGERVVSGPYRVLVDLKHDQRIRDMDEETDDEADDDAESPTETQTDTDADPEAEPETGDESESEPADADEVAESGGAP
ncbi:MAG: efflux RND transporter periplasmic adaptor subunit [Phycisphaerales bacterium JB059]